MSRPDEPTAGLDPDRPEQAAVFEDIYQGYLSRLARSTWPPPPK